MDDADEPTDPIAADLRDYVDFDAGEPTSHRVFATDILAVDVLCLEPDQFVGAREFATADVVYTCLGGRAWVVTPSAEVVLEPLQGLLVPAGVTHGLRNDAPDPLILQVSASPPDELPATHVGSARRPVHRGAKASSAVRIRRSLRERDALGRLRRVLGGPD